MDADQRPRLDIEIFISFAQGVIKVQLCLIGSLAVLSTDLEQLQCKDAFMHSQYWDNTEEMMNKLEKLQPHFQHNGQDDISIPIFIEKIHLKANRNLISDIFVEAKKNRQLNLFVKDIYSLIISKNLIKNTFFNSILIIDYLMSNLRQKKSNQQRQIIDHNYVNNIFFNALSTLQSLKLQIQDKHKQEYKKKLFTNYDKVDYSFKNLLELQSQFQTHLIIFRAAINSYHEDYKQVWSPPSNFDNKIANNFIIQALNIFRERSNDICCQLTHDFIHLIQGNGNNLYIDQVQITGNYSEQEKEQHRNTFFVNSSHAKMIMEEQKASIQDKKIQNKRQLQGNLNPYYKMAVTKGYLVTTKKYFNQYLQGSKGFDFGLLDGNKLYQHKQQAQNYLNKNEILVQLDICNNTVVEHKIIK